MATICEFNKTPSIEYPLFWSYRVIGDTDIKDDIKKAVGNKKHKINFSKFSSGGKYMSFEVSVFVKDEKERLEIFKALKGIAKFVL